MSAHLFHVIEDAHAILVCRGVYRQTKVYQRGGDLYASYGAGFVRLYRQGTSIPNLRLDALDGVGAVRADRVGRLQLEGAG